VIADAFSRASPRPEKTGNVGLHHRRDRARRRGALAIRAASLLVVLMCAPHGSPLSAQVSGAIEVTVRTASPDEAVAAATVRVLENGRTLTTTGTGIAHFRGLDPGPYTVEVTALGYERATLRVDATNGRITRARAILRPAPLPLDGVSLVVSPRTTPSRGIEVRPDALPGTVRDLPAALDLVPGAVVVR